MLPKTTVEIENGGVYEQKVRCGKSNCRCANGSFHTGFYFITRVEGRLRKIYVPRSRVKQIRRLVRKARRDRELRRAIRNGSFTLLTDFQEQIRQVRARILGTEYDGS